MGNPGHTKMHGNEENTDDKSTLRMLGEYLPVAYGRVYNERYGSKAPS